MRRISLKEFQTTVDVGKAVTLSVLEGTALIALQAAVAAVTTLAALVHSQATAVITDLESDNIGLPRK